MVIGTALFLYVDTDKTQDLGYSDKDVELLKNMPEGNRRVIGEAYASLSRQAFLAGDHEAEHRFLTAVPSRNDVKIAKVVHDRLEQLEQNPESTIQEYDTLRCTDTIDLHATVEGQVKLASFDWRNDPSKQAARKSLLHSVCGQENIYFLKRICPVALVVALVYISIQGIGVSQHGLTYEMLFSPMPSTAQVVPTTYPKLLCDASGKSAENFASDMGAQGHVNEDGSVTVLRSNMQAKNSDYIGK